MDCDTIEERCKLYAAIERADTQLVDTHELKVALARQLVEQCLLIHRGMLGFFKFKLDIKNIFWKNVEFARFC